MSNRRQTISEYEHDDRPYVLDQSDLNYLMSQLNRLSDTQTYTLQIRDGKDNSTKWLTIPREMFNRVKNQMGQLGTDPDTSTCIPDPPHDPGDLMSTCERCVYLNSYREVPSDAANAEDYEVYADLQQAADHIREAAESGILERDKPVFFYMVTSNAPMWRLTAPAPDRVYAEELSTVTGEVIGDLTYKY